MGHTINRDLPWRGDVDPYLILVSEVMLQQTPVNRVIQVFNRFMKKYPNLFELSKADVVELETIMYPLGLLSRSMTLKTMAIELIEKYGGNVPRSKEELLKIKGIGEYISSAILSFGYNEKVAIVDTNIIRVLSRIFGLNIMDQRNSPKKELLQFANSLIPNNPKEYNMSLLDFAQLICTRHNPKCQNCPMIDLCFYYKNTYLLFDNNFGTI